MNLDRRTMLISIDHPWASAAVMGRLDAISAAEPTDYRGPVLVHAGGVDQAARRFELAIGGQHLVEYTQHLLGTVCVYDCVPIEDCQLRFTWGPWCYLLENPLVFEAPLPWTFRLRRVMGSIQDSPPLLEAMAGALPPHEWATGAVARRGRPIEAHEDINPAKPDGYTGD